MQARTDRTARPADDPTMDPVAARLAKLAQDVAATRARARELQAQASLLSQRLGLARHALAVAGEASAQARRTARLLLQERTPAVLEQAGLPEAPWTPDPPLGAVHELLSELMAQAGGPERLVDELLVAHAEAEAAGEHARTAILAGLLLRLGRQLAHRVGPRAAGITLN